MRRERVRRSQRFGLAFRLRRYGERIERSCHGLPRIFFRSRTLDIVVLDNIETADLRYRPVVYLSVSFRRLHDRIAFKDKSRKLGRDRYPPLLFGYVLSRHIRRNIDEHVVYIALIDLNGVERISRFCL